MASPPHDHRDYWDAFYASPRRSDVPGDPSDFARWSSARMVAGSTVVEVGCGTARDALWFAAHGYPVRAYDYSTAAIQLARAAVGARSLEAHFRILDLYDRDGVVAEAADCAHLAGHRVVYARFMLHALEPDGQRNLFDFAAQTLGGSGAFYCEFRTGKDRGEQHVFGEHFRSYPEPEAVLAALEGAGAVIVHHEEGHGMAVYRDEDPHVCRLVASWQS